MAGYRVKTPQLQTVTNSMTTLLSRLEADDIDTKVAGHMVGAGNAVTRAVSTDLRVRLAARRLAQVEA